MIQIPMVKIIFVRLAKVILRILYITLKKTISWGKNDGGDCSRLQETKEMVNTKHRTLTRSYKWEL